MKILTGPKRFVLAGSGHIAGVVNPPAAGKYQYWTNDADPAPATLDDFVAGATEHKGSWWPDWIDWLQEQAPKTVNGDRRAGARARARKGDRGRAGTLRQDALIGSARVIKLLMPPASAVLILPVPLLAFGLAIRSRWRCAWRGSRPAWPR